MENELERKQQISPSSSTNETVETREREISFVAGEGRTLTHFIRYYSPPCYSRQGFSGIAMASQAFPRLADSSFLARFAPSEKRYAFMAPSQSC